MILVDTHTHLYLEEFDGDRKEVVENAIQEGVEKIFLPNIDSSSIESLLKMVSDYPHHCYSMMGLHPTSVKENFRDELAIIEKELFAGNHIAVGEIGIDLYWDKTFLKEQIEALNVQLEWASRLNLPVVIHARDSFDEIFMELENKRHLNLKGVFHSFTGTLEQARKAIDLGFMIGINGIVTFKNAGLDKVVGELELENILLETDAPYLAPTPKRGKRNESKFLTYTAKKIADVFGVEIEEVAKITSENAIKLFGIK